MRNDVTVTDLAGVVYSCGRAFDGLTTGRLDTGEFLRTGSTAGITSRAERGSRSAVRGRQQRTALFAANSLLLRSNQLIVVPDDTTTFNLHLAHAYLHHDDKGVKEMLRTEGIIPIGTEC